MSRFILKSRRDSSCEGEGGILTIDIPFVCVRQQSELS